MNRPSTKTNTGRPLVVSLILVVVGALAIANIVLSAKIATTGEELKALEEQASIIRKENQLLEQQVLEEHSLTSLAATAESLGFVEKPETIALTPDAPVALSAPVNP